MKSSKLTHINPEGDPAMVDISEKSITRRVASAQAIVHLGVAIVEQIRSNDLRTKKGPVFQTAILAGIMASKRTSDLIPLCHPLALEDCKVEITIEGNDSAKIVATAITSGKTGVEMEALTAASVAALTIYDMCKAMSHDITIVEVRLLEKTGGKQNFHRPA